MKNQITIVKSNAETELFDQEKLRLSLIRSGADGDVVEGIIDHVEDELIDGMHTADIYRHAYDLLKNKAKKAAARYSLKRAILALGPDGFPFEKFVAEIFKEKGYEVALDQIVSGRCADHEVDVVAWMENELVMVEAKFHNEQGLKSDLKVALYVKARFDDISSEEFDFGGKKRKLTNGWLVTNTKFTSHAIKYGKCQNLKMVGWNYPKTGNLEDLITKSRLHPITCLSSVSKNEQKILLQNGFVLCKHIMGRKEELYTLGISKEAVESFINEASEVCR